MRHNQRHALPLTGANSKSLSTAGLSQLIAKHRGISVEQLCSVASDHPVTLAEMIEAGKAQGYGIGEPKRHYPASKPLHSEWHLPISTAHGSAILVFLIPLDVS